MAGKKGRSGAPKGNTNAAKGKDWRDAIIDALAEEGPGYKEGLLKVARTLVRDAITGDIYKIKEIGDRIDGKAAQSVELSGSEEAPLRVDARVTFVKAR